MMVAHMRQARSIRVRLSIVFCFFLALVALLGGFSIATLSYVNGVSAEIRSRWLESTRLLGDLNNYTSDFRAAEGAMLLGAGTSARDEAWSELAELDSTIARTARDYERIAHDDTENKLYGEFQARWREYRATVDRVSASSAASLGAEATQLFRTTSRTSYDAASDTLGRLTDRTVAAAGEASGRAELAYTTARWLIGAAIVVATLMLLGAVNYIRRSISDPVLDLAGRLYRLAANETGVEINGAERRDEIGEMARAAIVFRNNAMDLALSRRALAQQASMLEEKLAEEQRLTQLQRNFVSMASHEFRTPLTIIDGHAQRLAALRHRLDADELAERAHKIRSAVRRMTNLIEGLLNSSRLTDGEVGLYFHPAEIDVRALLSEACQLHREIAPRSQIWENFPPEPLLLAGDAKLLFQVFSNLLSNAIKYSPDGGLITVTADAAADAAVVAVQDRGLGIPADDLPRLFERYYRASNVSGIVGTGVGLYFVKMVTELHQGDIGVESKEGEGSRFALTLPLALRATADAPKPEGEAAAADAAAPARAGGRFLRAGAWLALLGVPLAGCAERYNPVLSDRAVMPDYSLEAARRLAPASVKVEVYGNPFAVAPDAFAGQVASTMNQSAAAPAHFAAHAAQGVASAYRVVWNFAPPPVSIAPNAICEAKYIGSRGGGMPIDVYAAFCHQNHALSSVRGALYWTDTQNSLEFLALIDRMTAQLFPADAVGRRDGDAPLGRPLSHPNR
jgi:signal transduction histidine kinase